MAAFAAHNDRIIINACMQRAHEARRMAWHGMAWCAPVRDMTRIYVITTYDIAMISIRSLYLAGTVF